MKHKSMKFQLYIKEKFWICHQFKHAWPKGLHLSAINVNPMPVVTDISKYVTVAARQIILKVCSIKKLVVNIEISESRLFKEDG